MSVLLMEGESGYALVPRSMLASPAVRGLTPSSLRAWLALLSHASADAPRPFPSWKRLQKVAGLNRAQLARGLAGLREAGLLDVQRRGSTTARYTLRRPAPHDEVSLSETSEVSRSETSGVSRSETQKRPGKETTEESPLPPGGRGKRRGAGGAARHPASAPEARGGRKRAPRAAFGVGQGPSVLTRLVTWAGEDIARSVDEGNFRLLGLSRHNASHVRPWVEDQASDLVEEWQRSPEGRPWALVVRDERLTRERDRYACLGAVQDAVRGLDTSAVVAEALGLLAATGAAVA